MTREQQQEYEALDWVATTAHCQAEKQCHKFKMGQVPWTPDLTKKIYQILYWKGDISHALSRQVGTLVLQTPACKGGLQHSLDVIQSPLEQLQDKLAKDYHQYRQFKKEPNRQDTWLGQVIEAQAQATGQKTKALWKQVWSHEHVKLTAWQVNIALEKATTHRPLAIVSELVTVSSRQDCTTRKHALETACLAEARWQFTQANQTPCFQSSIWEIFGEMGIHCPAFDQVLEGTFEPPDSCNQYTKKYLCTLSGQSQ